jgi:hypothetical protein
MSARNFRNINRAFKRGHITVIKDQVGRTTLYRRAKSSGGGWVKDMHIQYAGGSFRKTPHLIPSNFVLV